MAENLESEPGVSGEQNRSSRRKRKKTGRLRDVAQKLRASSHSTGDPCRCNLQCFNILTTEERSKIIKDFNLMGSKNIQDSHLSGLISVLPIYRRRPRKDEMESNLRDHAYEYKIRVCRDDNIVEIKVCHKAFISLHGITRRRVRTVQIALATTGRAPADQRGKHTNRPHKFTEETTQRIKAHIGSFKGRKSHYSLHDSTKIYLPEELTITKMHKMYKDKYPKTSTGQDPPSYESYREIFNTDFNIGFGYPRSDTCSNCDEFTAKSVSLSKSINNLPVDSEERPKMEKELIRLQSENKQHMLKADKFYTRKRLSKQAAKKSAEMKAIVFDYQKNLPTPNISTSDVYYKRQLSFYSFNVHILSTQQSVFYTYDETVAKKGADEVVSFLENFVVNFLPQNVNTLYLFCDSCAGQNKNYTLFRYLHWLVHGRKRFKFIQVTFPVRGHSYLECDKNMGLVKQKTKVETPSEWKEVLRTSRVKPRPFDIVEVNQEMVFNWTNFFQTPYKKKSPFATRQISEINFTEGNPRTVNLRNSYNGAWESYDVVDKKFVKKGLEIFEKPEGPERLHNGQIPLSLPKYKDLQSLKKFCSQSAQEFFDSLTSTATARDGSESEEE